MRRFVKGVLNDLVEGELPTQIACKNVESDGACLKTISSLIRQLVPLGVPHLVTLSVVSNLRISPQIL